MESLIDSIVQELTDIIPDIEHRKAVEVARHLTSEQIGVRSLPRLYDVDKETLVQVLPRCDAQRLHRAWQTKFKPENMERQMMIQGPVTLYEVKWQQIPHATMKKLRQGKWLNKNERCEMVRLIVKDVMTEMPEVQRGFFIQVAQSMVKEYPAALQDRGENARPLECTYYTKKLRCRFDEAVRARNKKQGVEAPLIPEAYGCKKWRITVLPEGETKQSLVEKKQTLLEEFQNKRPKDYDKTMIENYMKLTYKLQRDDINSQVPKKRKRGRGEAQTAENPVKTTDIIAEEWPFLFQPRGMQLHFEILTGVNFPQKLYDFADKIDLQDLLNFLREQDKDKKWKSTCKKFNRAIKNDTCSDPEVIATCLMVINYFNEDQKQLLLEIEKTTRITELEEQESVPATPCIFSLGPVFEAKKFFFTVDSKAVSTVKTFSEALTLVFQSYFVLNLQYAANLGHTLEFYQRVVAGIAPEKGSKRKKRNYRCKIADKLQTLMDKYAVWAQEQQELDGSEDELNY